MHWLYRIIRRQLSASLLIGAAAIAHADLIAHFDMDVESGCIEESISKERYQVEGNFAPENVDGAVGCALRFDGYTSRVTAALGDVFGTDKSAMTVSLWVAVPSYPIIELDTDTSEKTAIVSCLDTESKTGFGFFIGFDGRYAFRTYVKGWLVEVEVDVPLPTYRWNHLAAVYDRASRSVKVYNNGVEMGAAKANGDFSFTPGPFYMGQGKESRKLGPFELMSFNGLVDDVSIWNEAIAPEILYTERAENEPDLDIPASRFKNDMLRPRFHGMPAAGWTNECHGMYRSDGRYHLFFQKNGDGPYMARLHWGHISTSNLYDWREEKIAIAPGDWYDIKGCWSGCVFSDDIVTDGKPTILYTAVDYAKAMIARADAVSYDLADWSKSSDNPIIAQAPRGLSDDFRDPYFFRNGQNAYMIVGSSVNGIGTTTLHRYDTTSRTWSNNGDLFFSGASSSRDGRFWEMPNITRMPNGKWLFTATPLETSDGVHTLYWTGSISDDGRFIPDNSSSLPRLVELNSREGFGMLSPTVFRMEEKTIALGIVPDKLPASINWQLGWAHCYSLPREWSLTESGELLQRPYEGLAGLRTDTYFASSDFNLDGNLDLGDVKGRELELQGVFEVGSSAFGFEIFKNANGAAKIYYEPAQGSIVIDLTALPRLQNDAGVYDGIYRCNLPERLQPDGRLKINVFVDHSILDIFINDRWATSVRVFPTDEDADGVEVFSNGLVKVKDLKAWVLDVDAGVGVGDVLEDVDRESGSHDVYDISGMKMPGFSARSNYGALPKGIYIIGKQKIMVR